MQHCALKSIMYSMWTNSGILVQDALLESQHACNPPCHLVIHTVVSHSVLLTLGYTHRYFTLAEILSTEKVQ